MDEFYLEWVGALRAMTSSAESAARFLDLRLRFTTEVANCLVHDDPRMDALLYGVWVHSHSAPTYIGQTTEGRRRLWDLPIGESHHLSNSFPPEIWDRVVVVYWGTLLESHPEIAEPVRVALHALVGENIDPRPAIGLGLEFLLQHRYQPLFNRRKKKRDGGWRDVDWTRSGSLGAKAAPFLDELFKIVAAVWDQLAQVQSLTTKMVVLVPGGRVVFPGSASALRLSNQIQP
jgi:hypothetical protein